MQLAKVMLHCYGTKWCKKLYVLYVPQYYRTLTFPTLTDTCCQFGPGVNVGPDRGLRSVNHWIPALLAGSFIGVALECDTDPPPVYKPCCF